MRNIRSILFATDLFSTGDEALNIAARLAQLFGARVHLLHAVKRHTNLHLADFPIVERASSSLLAVKNQLESLGAQTELLPVEFGSPAEVILHQAEKRDVDLIVMGCGRHLSGTESAAGATAEAVIQRARQPVLAVFPGATPESLRRVLCPVDHSATSRRAVHNGVRLAQALGSEITVLSVVPDVSWLAAAIEVGEFHEAQEQHDQRWRDEFDIYLQGVAFGEVPWHKEVRIGNPSDQIIATAKELQAGLIVMGATGRTGIVRALVGSVTRNILRRLPCSILVVKSEDLIDEFTEEDAVLVQLLFAEGEALLGTGGFEPAVAKFDQVLSHNPFHDGALRKRADALEALGQTERADRCRRRADALLRAAQGKQEG